MKLRLFPLFLICIATLAVSSNLCPGATTWTGTAGDKDWFNDGNWSGTAPAGGEDAIVHAGADIVLTNETAILGSLTLDGGTLTFSNWYARVIATNVVIDGATVTLPGEFTDTQMSNRVYFACSNDFTLTSGTIDVAGRGFAGAVGYNPGYGPGGGQKVYTAAGGGHGGRGGAQGPNASQAGGATNGLPQAPLNPGSGGAAYAGEYGDHGGGAIRIHAEGRVTINATINANALSPTGLAHTYSAGASGGSVYISCDTFGGSGTITADGSDAYAYGGGGGGGRIAIVYAPAAQSSEPPLGVTLTTDFGVGSSPSYGDVDGRNGDLGTLYFPDDYILTETIALPHVGQLIMNGVTGWAPSNVVVSAACDLRFPGDFDFAITNNMVVNAGRLDLGVGSDLDVGDSLILTNGGKLIVRSAPTNGVLAYGVMLRVTNDVHISDGAWLYPRGHGTNGSTPLLKLRSLTISTSDAGINADAGGFFGGNNPSASIAGYGPGAGQGGSYGSGGGYGGGGGLGGGSGGNIVKGGVTNGSATSPTGPGSGGGAYTTGLGGHGGGAIRMQASSNVVVNGTISANGANAYYYYAGGGSGGGIDITCRALSGTGMIRADGGIRANSAGGGGGGRIAIHYNAAAQSNATPVSITFSTAPGLGTYCPAEKGTICFPPLLGEVFSLPHVGTLVLPGTTTWAPTNITTTAACDLRLPDSFTVTVARNITIGGGGTFDLGYDSDLDVGGSLILTNSGSLVVRAGATNGTGTSYGALVNVATNFLIYTNSWLLPYSEPLDGGCVLFQTRNFKILDGTCGVNADGKGYAAGNRHGNTTSHGMGPGGGSGAYYGAGGGHGGKGGNYSGNPSYPGGPTNGYANAPGAGSGGGSYGSSPGSDGGGAVRIEASGNVVVNGTITANGVKSPATDPYSGGGAGGGIWLIGRTFSGGADALLKADGYAAHASYSGSGAGGRIAVWSGEPIPAARRALVETDQAALFVTVTNQYAGYVGAVSATNGTPGNVLGTPGSIVFVSYDPPPSGTLLLIL